ncbi:hypothetical protein JTB14_037699 [Gonioctena quinquepunctata]|nr:hypothetical protein JTB14_037699 [Gonioctena quinquepunctata]
MELEKEFSKGPYTTRLSRIKQAVKLNLTENAWFENRRAKGQKASRPRSFCRKGRTCDFLRHYKCFGKLGTTCIYSSEMETIYKVHLHRLLCWDKEPPDRGPQHPNLDTDTPNPPSRGRSRTRNVSKEQFLKRKQDDASRSPTVTGRSASSNIPRKTEPNKGNTRNKSNSKTAQTPVSKANVCAASSSKTSIETMFKSQNKEIRKIAIETAAPEIASIDEEAEKAIQTPTSSPPDKKAKHEEKVLEKVMKVDELLTAHPQESVFATDSDVAQVLMDGIETPTPPPPTSGIDTNTATLSPSTEIGGAIYDNIEQEVRETNVQRTEMSKITPLLDTEKQTATLPPPAVEIDSKDSSTPPPPEDIQGDTQETETVITSIHDTTVGSEQSDEHNKEIMDEENDIEKHLDGALNTEVLVSKILDGYEYSSSDTSDTNIKLHGTDKTSEIPKSQSMALDDGRPPASKDIQHSGIYSYQHCSFDQTHSVMVITEITRDEEIRRPRDLFVTQDSPWKCRSCEGENTEEIRVAVFSDEESNEEEDDEGAQSVISTGSSPITKVQDHDPLSPGADSTTLGQAVKSIPGGALDASQDTKRPLPEKLRVDENTQDQVLDTFHQTFHSLPADKEPKNYKEEGHIEPQHTPGGNSKKTPHSQLSPTSSTRQEGNNGENELSSINKEQSSKKTPSQESSEFRDTFHETSDPPKIIPNQEIVFSSDVEESNIQHTSNYTCANLPQDSLPSSHKGGTVLDPLSNAYFRDSRDQRNLIGRREQVHDPAKLTKLYGEQTFSYIEQNTVEKNNLFITPNIHVESEDGKYNFSFPIKSVYTVPEPGPEKCPNYTSETIKGVDKQINKDRTNPQRTMDVDLEKIKYTTVIVKKADVHQQQKNDDELHAQHMVEFNSEYSNPNTDGKLAESEKETERDYSSTCSSEEQMETDQIIGDIPIHTDKDNKAEDINAIKESGVKTDTEKIETFKLAEMLKKDREDNLAKEKERKAKREEIKKRRKAQRKKDEEAKNTEKTQEAKTRRKDSLDKIEVIQSDNRNGTTTLSTPSKPKLNKDISDGIEITPSTSFIQHPTHNQMTDRLDILYRQVDEESEKMTEDLLNNMINHNPKVEGSKLMLRERLKEAVYNTSREICIKSKEQEIHRLNSMLGFIKSPGVKEGKTQKFSQESEEEGNQLTVPRKTTKIPTPVKNPVLVIKNNYQQLEMKDKETDTGVSEEHTKEILDSIATENKTKAQQEPVQRVRDRKIPPIVVAGKMIMTQCANCTGAHSASYRQCPVYLNRLDVIEKRKFVAAKGKKKYVNAPDPKENAWTKKAQERENQNSAREARQLGSGAQETQPTHYPPPSNNTQVGTVVSGGFANENSGQGIKALSDKFKILGNLIDIPNMLDDIHNSIQEVQRTTDKHRHRQLIATFFLGDYFAY